jgi:hypothetical protein
MRSVISAVVAAVVVSVMASAASAKVLVFCSEAEPEGFDPAALCHRRHVRRFVAGNLQSSRRVRPRRRHGRAGARRKLGCIGGRPHLHVPPQAGSELSFGPPFPADARSCRRRCRLQPCPSARSETSVVRLSWRPVAVLRRHVASAPGQVGGQGRRPDGRRLFWSGRTHRSRPRLPWISPRSCPRNTPTVSCRPERPALLDTQPIGTGPYRLVGYDPGVRIDYRVAWPLLARRAGARSAGVRNHAGSGRKAAPASDGRMRCHGRSRSGRSAGGRRR